MPVAALSKAWFAGARLLGFLVRIRLGGKDVSCECLSSRRLCVGHILVQRSPTDCGVFECECEASIMWRP